MKYVLTHIKNTYDASRCYHLYNEQNPTVGAFDTETDGLNIGAALPFVFSFGWAHEDTIYVFALDLTQGYWTESVAEWWLRVCPALTVGHNICFDLHMLRNKGLSLPEFKKLSDTMFYIRWAQDNIPTSKGGVPLKLKDYCARYISPKAKEHEKHLSIEKTAFAKEHNMDLKRKLGRKWTLKKVEDFFKDPTTTLDDLPEEDQRSYLEWYYCLPEALRLKMTTMTVKADEIPYTLLNRLHVIEYAMMDIVWTLKVYFSLAPVIWARGNNKAIEIENALLEPIFEMERTGFKIDWDYLQESEVQVRQYIKERRNDLKNLCGKKITVSQHAEIKRLLETKWNVHLASTGNDELEAALESFGENQNPDVVAFIAVIQELRTLEKWYSTYIQRFLRDKDAAQRCMVYTQINQVGTVSGRVTSDFQQFPKDPIKDKHRNELFHPRKLFLVPRGYDNLTYLDYSQIELRLQGMYTILVGNPDKNLLRAYMPYKCTRNGVQFDYQNPEHIASWDSGDWYQEEDGQLWQPTDLHGLTTQHAFGITPDHPDFKKKRYLGKRINFMKNYGGTARQVRRMFPHASEEEVERIDGAYYKAFPGVKSYHRYCYDIAVMQAGVTNLFGIRYYGVSGHNLINMLVQGSAAFLLKIKLIEIHRFLKARRCQSRMQMNIHDEISFCMMAAEAGLIPEIKKIMESYDETYVPIVAELEQSDTNWAEKKEAA